MKVYQASLHGVLLIEPKAFEDERGFFLESYNERAMADIGIQHPFVQDSHAFAARDVLQGLHYQVQRPQGKLIRVVVGEILYVSVDLRKSSPTSGRWFGTVLSGINKRMLWIPPGFAHGFVVLSDGAHVLTKATEFDRPELERTVAWNDPHLDIEWALKGHPIVSNKEKRGVPLRQAEMFD
ncbi:MAG: dTDP-4-dehydrorhamnose 3,5-epimerase [Candidatus Sulfotelmatobacter sp.]|jgi:dTDP-4-dehydrorhamnose 3,5-epimerase